MTTQQLRGVLHIVWTTRAAISLCIRLSLTVYYGDWGGLLQSPSLHTEAVCDIGPIYFPLTFFLYYIVRRACSQSAGSPRHLNGTAVWRKRLFWRSNWDH